MLSALGFLTILGGAHRPDERTLRWFPPVGAGIGGLLALVWAGADELWSGAVAAAVVVAADLVLTGILHLDGLADTADGLLPPLDGVRRLEVMRQPDVGAFALAVVPTVLLLRWTALAGGGIEGWALVALWCASRTCMAVAPAHLRYARDEGLASALLGGAGTWIAVWFVPAGALLVVVHGGRGAAALVALVVVATSVLAYARARIGGFTGDVLGAVAVLGETAALLTLAAAP